MTKRWVENTGSRPRQIDGQWVLPGSGVFVDEPDPPGVVLRDAKVVSAPGGQRQVIVDGVAYGLMPAATAASAESLVSPDGISDALVAAYDAGMFALPAGTRLGTIAGVPTASILLDAGSGGTVTTARVTFAPPTDTIGAQRLLTPTDETYTLTMDSALDVTLGDLGGIALAMHAIGVSTDAVLTGESYVAESDYTLAEYIAGDARFEWLDSTPTRVRLTLQRGSSTRYATLSVVAEVSA